MVDEQLVAVQAGDQRPRRIAVVVVLLAAWWLIPLVLNVAHLPSNRGDRLENLAGLAGFTGVVGLVLWRLWAGSPTAWSVIVQFAMPVGLALLVGLVALFVLFERSPAFDAIDVPLPIVGIVDAVVLLAGGLIARTGPVRAWCHRHRVGGR